MIALLQRDERCGRVDASSHTNRAAHDMALRRVVQAGGVCVTALHVLLEFGQEGTLRRNHGYHKGAWLLSAGDSNVQTS